MANMVRAAAEGRHVEALRLHQQFYPLFKSLFIETNPVPVKEALHLQGRLALDLRLPLVPMNAEKRARLRQVMDALELLPS
jgi:4-hydroxy-tetrahydrodipicolinate synthase